MTVLQLLDVGLGLPRGFNHDMICESYGEGKRLRVKGAGMLLFQKLLCWRFRSRIRPHTRISVDVVEKSRSSFSSCGRDTGHDSYPSSFSGPGTIVSPTSGIPCLSMSLPGSWCDTHVRLRRVPGSGPESSSVTSYARMASRTRGPHQLGVCTW